ncbi:EAL domain-containing protein [Pararobbsia alpina]|uniref:EAL domain-containing protein n=1 Tax=Pararobbsia alpina TaxID=621374 RepID=UPI0039A59D42
MTIHSTSELLELAASHPQLAGALHAGENGSVEASAQGVELSSEYLAIYDLASYASSGAPAMSGVGEFGDEVGFEAKLKARDSATGQILSLPDLFATIRDDQQLVSLDRLARALHAINFFGQHRNGLLFLNVHERLLKSVRYDHGRYFSLVLLSFGLNPGRIVIEIPEAASAHKTFLGYLTKSYQSYGFKVAGNLSNAGQILSAAESRLDFVKIDTSAAIRDSMVKPLVGYANRLKVPLIFKRIRDEAQFRLLRQYDVRYVEGDYLSTLATDDHGPHDLSEWM